MKKVIVTNVARLREKYGLGFRAVEGALAGLVAADREHGIETELVALDDAARMAALDAPAVASWADPRQNKEAVDRVCARLAPDSLLLLGAPDVIPHVDVRHPLHACGFAAESTLRSDMPYACAAPYGRDAEAFVFPVRAVGRIGGLPGARGPSLLAQQLHTAAGRQPRMQRAYEDCFALAAAEREVTARLGLRAMFRTDAALHVCPPADHRWAMAQMGGRLHYLNALGVPGRGWLTGSRDGAHRALDAAWVAGRIPEGTVAAATAGYAAEPGDAMHAPLGVAGAYLLSGAYGFLGATGAAWSTPGGSDWSDLLCLAFLNRVLWGESLGAALLGARRAYVAGRAVLSPLDLATLHSFVLLGDPSTVAVQLLGDDDEERAPDAVARTTFEEVAAFPGLGDRVAYAVPAGKAHAAPEVAKRIRETAAQLTRPRHARFDLRSVPRGGGEARPEDGAVHLVFDDSETRLLLERGAKCVYQLAVSRNDVPPGTV